MTRVKKILGLAAVLTALWTVGGAEWPVDTLLGVLGGIRCC